MLNDSAQTLLMLLNLNKFVHPTIQHWHFQSFPLRNTLAISFKSQIFQYDVHWLYAFQNSNWINHMPVAENFSRIFSYNFIDFCYKWDVWRYFLKNLALQSKGSKYFTTISCSKDSYRSILLKTWSSLDRLTKSSHEIW